MSTKASAVSDELQDALREVARLRQEAIRLKEDRAHLESDLRRRFNRAEDAHKAQLLLLQDDLTAAREERNEAHRLLQEREQDTEKKLAEKDKKLEEARLHIIAAKQERNEHRKTLERILGERYELKAHLDAARKERDALRQEKGIQLSTTGQSNVEAEAIGGAVGFLSLPNLVMFSSSLDGQQVRMSQHLLF